MKWLSRRWHLMWSVGMYPGLTGAVICAVVFVALATLAREALGFVGPDPSAFAPYYSATLIAVLVGGGTAGCVAAVLGGVIAYFLFMQSIPNIAGSFAEQLISLFQYCVCSAVIIWAAMSHRYLLQRLREEEEARRLLNSELVHRIKNVLASVQAIVSQSLKEQVEVRDTVNARIAALGITHDLLIQSGWQGASLHEIFIREFSPFDLSRFELEGEDIQCPSDTVTVLALIFHELTTNAVKYGALSRPEGSVSISWHKVKSRLNVEWREKGGPPPASQIDKGFGMKLLQLGLKPFLGVADIRLEPAGLVCNLYLELPEERRKALPSSSFRSESLKSVIAP